MTADSSPELPAPLDAYVTAKPDEPTFTLQGGDPLAPPIVQLWAHLARCRADVLRLSELPQILIEMRQAIQENNLVDNERERNNLLVRATAAEEVSWGMRAYQKNVSADAAEPTSAGENFLEEKDRLDLHDLRVRFAQRLSTISADIAEMREALHVKGGFFCGEHDPIDNEFLGAQLAVKHIAASVEPRRLFQKST